MALDLSQAPEGVRAMIADLDGEGFTLVAEQGAGAVNRLLELRRESCVVRITADRGEWWIELGGPALEDWFDPDIWQACLDDVPVQMEPTDLDEQVAFVRQRWPDVAKALNSPKDHAECLDRARSTRARTRLGLPPRAGNEVS